MKRMGPRSPRRSVPGGRSSWCYSAPRLLFFAPNTPESRHFSECTPGSSRSFGRKSRGLSRRQGLLPVVPRRSKQSQKEERMKDYIGWISLVFAVVVAGIIYIMPGADHEAKLKLAIGYGVLILVFFYGMVVLLLMASGKID